jgi:hypothetical protein
LVIHPAPICVLNVPVVLGALFFSEKTSVIMNEYYSVFNYWLENIVFLTAFFAFELVLVIPVYLKNIFIMGFYTDGMFASLARMLFWILVGPIYSIILALWDVKQLFKILKMHDGCRAKAGLGDEFIKPEIKTEV